MRAQRRRLAMAMTAEAIDRYLSEQRTCRVATFSKEGLHVVPLWFVWDGTALWLYSLIRSQRWADVMRDPRVAVVVDDGHDFFELRGIEIVGWALPVGEVPRVGEPNDQLAEPERLFARKYLGVDSLPYDQRHAWLRIEPEKITSWDHRKLAS